VHPGESSGITLKFEILEFRIFATDVDYITHVAALVFPNACERVCAFCQTISKGFWLSPVGSIMAESMCGYFIAEAIGGSVICSELGSVFYGLAGMFEAEEACMRNG